MAKRRLTRDDILAQLPAARARERAQRRAGWRARKATYEPNRGLLILELTNGTVFGFPPSVLPALRRLTAQQLAQVALSPSGGGLHWEAQDIQVSVPGVLMSSFDRAQQLSELARLAGSTRSNAKARAARVNGAKGGRPRKTAKARRSPAS